MTKKSRQKFQHLENKKELLISNKKHHHFKGLSSKQIKQFGR